MPAIRGETTQSSSQYPMLPCAYRNDSLLGIFSTFISVFPYEELTNTEKTCGDFRVRLSCEKKKNSAVRHRLCGGFLRLWAVERGHTERGLLRLKAVKGDEEEDELSCPQALKRGENESEPFRL